MRVFMFAKDDLISTMRCERDAMLPCKLDWPMRKICYWGGQPTDVRPAGANIWTDHWGITWRKESPQPHMMPFPIDHPIGHELEGIKSFASPPLDHETRFADLAHLRCPANELLVGEHPFALYERAWLIAGMQNLLAAMASHPERVDHLFAVLGDFEYDIAQAYLELPVEAAWISDDYGMNSALMFSPAMWRRFVRPHLKRIVDLYHERNVLVVLHSCGNITPLIEDFLEVGVDVIDPLQPHCNNLDMIRRKTSGRMCLCGGVCASTLLSGDADKTLLDTQAVIERLGSDGGFIVGPDDDQPYPDATHDAMLSIVQDFRDSQRIE